MWCFSETALWSGYHTLFYKQTPSRYVISEMCWKGRYTSYKKQKSCNQTDILEFETEYSVLKIKYFKKRKKY